MTMMWRPETPGESISGALVGIEVVDSRPILKVHTGTETISACVNLQCGYHVLVLRLRLGCQVKITYNGKEVSRNGNKYHSYKIERVI
jgi:hypothetical protein